LVLASGGTMKLGTFPGSFACALRDGLQEEIKKRLA